MSMKRKTFWLVQNYLLPTTGLPIQLLHDLLLNILDHVFRKLNCGLSLYKVSFDSASKSK